MTIIDKWYCRTAVKVLMEYRASFHGRVSRLSFQTFDAKGFQWCIDRCCFEASAPVTLMAGLHR
jgi:hypothetical protein